MTHSLIRGGVDLIQLRAKNESPEEILLIAKELAPLCRRAGIPFILNDHPELVREAGVDGAHVGQEDLSVAEARKLAGPDSIIGKSTHSVKQAIAATSESLHRLWPSLCHPDETRLHTDWNRGDSQDPCHALPAYFLHRRHQTHQSSWYSECRSPTRGDCLRLAELTRSSSTGRCLQGSS